MMPGLYLSISGADLALSAALLSAMVLGACAAYGAGWWLLKRYEVKE